MATLSSNLQTMLQTIGNSGGQQSSPYTMGGATSYNENAAKESLGKWTREDWDRFVTTYTPLLKDQLGSLSDNKLVTSAAADADAVNSTAPGIRERALGRRGAVLTGDQQAEMSRLTSTGAGLGKINAVNQARVAQRERNEAAAGNVASLGAKLRNEGIDNMRQSIGLASSRSQNNAAAKAQADSANKQTATAALTTAAMIAAYMY